MASPAISLPREMQALQITKYNAPYSLRTVPVPKPGPHDLLVKVAVASYCHTDSMVRAGAWGSALPQTASHEGSGTIVAVGESVSSSSSFAIGDRVMCGIPLHPCGSCDECTGPVETQRQYCRKTTGHIGVSTHGCAAEYVIADARTTNKIPDSVSLMSAAPLACAGRTVYRAILQTGLEKRQWVAIVGAGGGLGHLGVQFARALGLNVVAIDARDEGLALARECGANAVVDSRQDKAEVVKGVQALTDGGRGADAAIVLADHAEALACAVTKMHGTVVQVAQPATLSIPFGELVFRDIRLRGSLVASAGESEDMLRCVVDYGVKPVTNKFVGLGMEQVDAMLGLVGSGKMQGKAVLVVDPEQLRVEKDLGAEQF
ncbi:GroES-like protein [Nemania sp. FL0916]|nr:GroES-like protein [Nemania sp. FL0916]